VHAYAIFQAHLAISESIDAAARERMFRDVRQERSLSETIAAVAARLRAALTTPVFDADDVLPRLHGYPYES
jgi:hypothetical protein